MQLLAIKSSTLISSLLSSNLHNVFFLYLRSSTDYCITIEKLAAQPLYTEFQVVQGVSQYMQCSTFQGNMLPCNCTCLNLQYLENHSLSLVSTSSVRNSQCSISTKAKTHLKLYYVKHGVNDNLNLSSKSVYSSFCH